MRTAARETLFKIVFASQFNGNEEAFINALFKAEKLNKDDVEYCREILALIEENSAEFTEIIDNHSRLFPESRLFPADRSILFIALAEILKYGKVPFAVSVNEAANIASKYSSAKSASFVSGILSEIIKERKDV